MTTSRILLPDCTGRTVLGLAPAHVGQKLEGHEFRPTDPAHPDIGRADIKNYVITHIEFDAEHDHYTFFTN